MEKREFIEAKDRLSLVAEAKNVLKAYEPNSGSIWMKLATISRLFEIQGYNEITVVLGNGYSDFSQNYDCLRCFLSIIRVNCKEIADMQFLHFVVKFLLDIASECSCQYESFITCQEISSLAMKNKFLPPNPILKVFFTKISELCKESNQFIGYLNSLHILNEIEKVSLSKEEFNFVKKCAEVKNERFPRDLFCGFKVKEPNSIVIDNLSDDPNFVPDPQWQSILRMAEQDSLLDFDENSEESMQLASFMTKNDIYFEISDDKIKILKRPFDGFTTKVFNIIRAYEPRAEDEVPEIIEEIKLSSPVASKTKPKPAIRSEVKPAVFKNRFGNAQKKYKALCKYASIEFQDNFYCQRNQQKFDSFVLSNGLFEDDKSLLSRNKARIEDLYDSLVKEMAEKQKKLELENIERKKKEDEARTEEENAKKWFNLPKKPISQNSAVPCGNKSKSSWSDKKDTPKKPSNIYVPKITTLDLASVSESLNATEQSLADSSSNRSYAPKNAAKDLPSKNIYVPKLTTSDLFSVPDEKKADLSQDAFNTPAGNNLYKFDRSTKGFKDDRVKSKSTSWHKTPEAKDKQQDQKKDD